jgi:hypothetical protein
MIEVNVTLVLQDYAKRGWLNFVLKVYICKKGKKLHNP